jgi:nickel-type superoxide dismutase maturation protease
VRWPIWRVAVAESSMAPTLRPGDWLLVWRGNGRIKPGQVVIARHPGYPEVLLVKRVAWLESGGWWLNSDNPAAGAIDSFRFGPLPAGLIEGRVLVRYWPAFRRQPADSGRPRRR